MINGSKSFKETSYFAAPLTHSVRQHLATYRFLSDACVTYRMHATPLVTNHFPPKPLRQVLQIWDNVFYSLVFFTLPSFLLFKSFLALAVQPESYQDFMLMFETLPRPNFLYESPNTPQKVGSTIYGSFYLYVKVCHGKKTIFLLALNPLFNSSICEKLLILTILP